MSSKDDRDIPENDTPAERGNESGRGSSPNEEQPVCAMCGHPISPDDVVCPSCGTSLAAG